jgi:6-phosphogluconate dehydrogenase
MAGSGRGFGIVGLGNIGGNLAAQALARGFRVVGHDTREPDRALCEAGLEWAGRLEALRDRLTRPRAVFLYVPAGPIVDSVLDALAQVLEPGDVVVDGGNSYWGDSIARHRRMTERGLRFADVGTSGGLPGARNGACFMAGGEPDTIAIVEPILKALAVEGGYVHAGPPGAGHFTKLVHNGIEFGMLQAIGEGVDLLANYRDDLPIADILRCWANGSVIRSWLVELMEQQFRAQGSLERIPGYVEDTGEVNWLVDDAMQMEVPIPVITQSVIQLLASRDAERNWARAVAMMRHGFGNHPFGPDKRVAANRPSSRIGPFRPRTAIRGRQEE